MILPAEIIAPVRFSRIDALRGLAMVWMTAFHLSFDLTHFGFAHQDFYNDAFWTWQRSSILSLFLFCAGLSQAVALDQGQTWPRFWRRWGQIALCALLVTAGSVWMFPQSFIYFGVLHGIAFMLIIVRLTAGWGVWLWLASGLAVAAKFIASYAVSAMASAAFLNGKAWNWLGLISVKPITEDYVPLVPWLGLMWFGMVAGQWLLANRRHWLTDPILPVARPLGFLGQWSLSYYMLHQPILIGALIAFTATH